MSFGNSRITLIVRLLTGKELEAFAAFFLDDSAGFIPLPSTSCDRGKIRIDEMFYFRGLALLGRQ